MFLSRVELDDSLRSTMQALVCPQKLHGAVIVLLHGADLRGKAAESIALQIC